MRSIIEVSAYVIIITIMCYLGIDYVRMNMQVMDMNEAVRYVENYIEINGTINHKNINLTCEKKWYYVTGHDFMRMYYTDGNEADAIPEFVYEGDTDDYSYFKMITDYNMGSLFFNVKNKHTYKGIVRIPKMESL